MHKTSDGKWVMFDLATGEQREYWPVDAKALIAAGTHSAEPPAGTSARSPFQPPKHVPAPRSASASVFEVDGESEAAGEPAAADLPEGYQMERAAGWWKAYGPDGEQIGASTRNEDEALALIEEHAEGVEG
jgi:hypothetical protein